MHRLKKLAEGDSSFNVNPNGIIWNDNIWDTYDDNINNNTKSHLKREWEFEKNIDNSEWNLLQN